MYTTKISIGISNLQPFWGSRRWRFILLLSINWREKLTNCILNNHNKIVHKIPHSQLLQFIWSSFPRWGPIVHNREFDTFQIPFCIYLKLFISHSEWCSRQMKTEKKHITELLYALIVPQLVCFYQTASSSTITTTAATKNEKHRSAVGIITLSAHIFFFFFSSSL